MHIENFELKWKLYRFWRFIIVVGNILIMTLSIFEWNFPVICNFYPMMNYPMQFFLSYWINKVYYHFITAWICGNFQILYILELIISTVFKRCMVWWISLNSCQYLLQREKWLELSITFDHTIQSTITFLSSEAKASSFQITEASAQST